MKYFKKKKKKKTFGIQEKKGKVIILKSKISIFLKFTNCEYFNLKSVKVVKNSDEVIYILEIVAY